MDRRSVHDQLMMLRVRRDEPLPPFAPGQHTRLGLGAWEDGPDAGPADDDGLLRGYFSVSSPVLDDAGDRLLDPAAETFLEFYLAHDGGPLAARLFALQPGDRLWMAPKATGRYTLDGLPAGAGVLFIATGTGEAPHNRMIWDLLRRGHAGRIASVVSCRRRADLGYLATHERLAALLPRYAYLSHTTREAPPGVTSQPDVPPASGDSRTRGTALRTGGRHGIQPGPAGPETPRDTEGARRDTPAGEPAADAAPHRRLQDLLEDGTIAARTGIPLDPARTRVFVCGNAAMVGRPRHHAGVKTYPRPTGVIELLETRFGFRSEPGGEVRFERV